MLRTAAEEELLVEHLVAADRTFTVWKLSHRRTRCSMIAESAAYQLNVGFNHRRNIRALRNICSQLRRRQSQSPATHRCPHLRLIRVRLVIISSLMLLNVKLIAGQIRGLETPAAWCESLCFSAWTVSKNVQISMMFENSWLGEEIFTLFHKNICNLLTISAPLLGIFSWLSCPPMVGGVKATLFDLFISKQQLQNLCWYLLVMLFPFFHMFMQSHADMWLFSSGGYLCGLFFFFFGSKDNKTSASAAHNFEIKNLWKRLI